MKRIRDLNQLKDDLRGVVDMVAYVSAHIDGGLSQRGPNYFGLCPFHEESTGSFNVTPEAAGNDGSVRGIWSCFGCRESGDLFDFVQRMENCNFAEALEILARESNFDLTPYYRELSPEEQYRENQYDFMDQLADLLHAELMKSPAHLHFYAERGIEPETLAKFKIGYCPSIEWFQAVVGKEAEWIEPIQSHREKLFNGHLLYPQFTAQGRIWGFFARQDPGVQPKYIGPSRSAALFEGGARLYGLFQARQLHRKAKGPFLIVEGFHDAMVSQQANIPTVAVCGTELSDDQVKTLQGHAVTNAIVCFDDDEGGRSAMLRLAGRAHEINGMNLKFMRVPSEPSEFIVSSGADAFRARLQDAKCAVEFIVSHYGDLDVSTPTKIRDFLDHIRPYLTNYPRNSIDRALGVKAVADRVGLAPVEIADFLEEHQEHPLANPRAEVILLAEFACNPQAWVLYDGVTPEDFSLEKNRRTFALMQQCYQNEAEVNPDLLLTVARNQREPATVLETIELLPHVQRASQESLFRDVRDKALRRRAQALAGQMVYNLADLKLAAPEAIAAFVGGVTDIMSGSGRRATITQTEAVTLAIAEFERRNNMDTEIAGLDMGPDWANLMRWLNGLRGKRMHIIAATSGVGKSVFGLTNVVYQLSVNPAGPQAAGFVVTQEMDTNENIGRLVSVHSRVPHYLIDHARFDSQEQADTVAAAFEHIYSSPITWMEKQRTMREIALQARLLHSRGMLQYLVIDYVQLLDLSPYNNKWSTHEKYGQASQEILELAADLEIPIIAIAQLNRSAYQEDIPTGEQMGGAYKIYQDAHACITLAKRSEQITLAFLDKNRGGADKKAVELAFNRDERAATLHLRELSVKGHVA